MVLLAAVVAAVVSSSVLGDDPAFNIPPYSLNSTVADVPASWLLGLASGGVSVAFLNLERASTRFFAFLERDADVPRGLHHQHADRPRRHGLHGRSDWLVRPRRLVERIVVAGPGARDLAGDDPAIVGEEGRASSCCRATCSAAQSASSRRAAASASLRPRPRHVELNAIALRLCAQLRRAVRAYVPRDRYATATRLYVRYRQHVHVHVHVLITVITPHSK